MALMGALACVQYRDPELLLLLAERENTAYLHAR